jgi:hypothetical protein
MPGVTADLQGHFDKLTNFGASGHLAVGIPTIDIGPLGRINIASGVIGTLTAGFDGNAATAKAAGTFEFAGQQFDIASFDIDINAGIPSLPPQFTNKVTDALQRYLGDAEKWADAVGQGFVTGAANVAGTLAHTYRVAATDAGRLMKVAGQSAEATAGALKSLYGKGAADTANIIKAAGYTAEETGRGLKSAFNVAGGDAAHMLKQAGYGVNDVGDALKTVYGSGADDTARMLKSAGYNVNETGNYIKSAFGLGPTDLKSALETAGYAGDEIKGLFNDLGGDFKSVFGDVGSTVGGLVSSIIHGA